MESIINNINYGGEMIINDELQKLISTLVDQNVASIFLEGNQIFVRILNDASHLSISSLIWQGTNFIPLSIRDLIASPPLALRSYIDTKAVLDEKSFQIYLTHSQEVSELSHVEMGELLHEFSMMASKWRFRLDDYDKRDLVHIPVR